MSRFSVAILLSLVWNLASAPVASAQYYIWSGNAVMTFNLTATASVSPFQTINAFFDNSYTRSQLLSSPSGTGLPPTWPTPPDLTFNINPATVTNPAGRSLQATTLNFDPNNVLATWTPVTSDIGAFASGGEQIGLEGMTRWSGPFGTLLFGDFGLRYSTSRVGTVVHDNLANQDNTLSGLVLTSNIDFLNATYADLANASISNDSGNSRVIITADLVYSDAMGTLTGDPSVIGTNIGHIVLTANYAPVPEPASVGLFAFSALGLMVRFRQWRGRVRNLSAIAKDNSGT